MHHGGLLPILKETVEMFGLDYTLRKLFILVIDHLFSKVVRGVHREGAVRDGDLRDGSEYAREVRGLQRLQEA